ncbi:putative acetyltransferase [Teratosphaeria destructans]|uniref:Acetyltransferase n=1 Tax=Teratosphaeria destructans TaxID=418781 RepID=A0A9W7SSJ0_9PEZI|nr:putative acetyltransferase [Teratosphaeria destructans]
MAASQKKPEELEKAKQLNNTPTGDQYERMISGMLYDAQDTALATARFRGRKWMHNYNNVYFPQDPDADFSTLEVGRLELLRQLIGRLDGGAFIEPPFSIDYGCNIKLGDRFYSNFNLVILDCALVTIGDRCMFGPNISILTATHETEVQSRRDDVEYARPITIGNDCWIGGNVVVLPGVTIGDGCTIGAGSVVTKDVPSWSVALGSPARVVRKVKPLEDVPERTV